MAVLTTKKQYQKTTSDDKQKKKRKSAYISFKDKVILDHEKQNYFKIPQKEFIQGCSLQHF